MTWEQKKLSSLGVEAKTGFAAGRHSGTGEILHLRPMNISPLGEIVLEGGKYVSASAGIQRVHRGDVLFNNTNSPKWVGKTAWIGTENDLAFSNHMTRLRVSESSLDSKFLAFYLHYKQNCGYFEARCANHVNQASISRTKLLETEIPVPPLGEQRRIVSILEEHLSHLDSADALLDEVSARVSGLSEKLFSDRINEISFGTMSLGELLIGRLTNGKSVPTADAGFPVLRLTALGDGKIDLAQRKIGAWNKEEAERFLVAKNDFLISRGNGSLNLVGRGGVVGEVRDAVAYPDTLIRARLNSDLVDLDFFSLVFNSKCIRSQIESMAKTTAGIYKINQKDLGSLVVPIPSLDDQRNIAADVSGQREKLTSAQRMVVTGCKRSTALRSSLLHAAFTGRLTEQSASEMVAVAGA